MQIKEKKIDDLNLKLTVTLDKADWEEPRKKKLNAFRHQADIKGFRKGMAPMSLIEHQQTHRGQEAGNHRRASPHRQGYEK